MQKQQIQNVATVTLLVVISASGGYKLGFDSSNARQEAIRSQSWHIQSPPNPGAERRALQKNVELEYLLREYQGMPAVVKPETSPAWQWIECDWIPCNEYTSGESRPGKPGSFEGQIYIATDG
ncbi:hypothetical protein [Blastopirellula marina]|uniref:hypothetical protein n=1 Tax=Blastopirellula marina TaxID=124 RepID=UPI00103FB46A|nr:hypothetical protein [Blastopirellula marina]